jgi:hypothetical protein
LTTVVSLELVSSWLVENPAEAGIGNQSDAGSDNESAIEDSLEKSESYELKSHDQM